MELLEFGPGVDSEFLGQRDACCLVGMQGFALPAGPVQGEHELSPEPLVQPVPGGQFLQPGHQLAVPSQAQGTFGVPLESLQVQPPQAGRFLLHQPLRGNVTQRQAPP